MFIQLTRKLPENVVEILVNTDNIVWLQPAGDNCAIYPVIGPEIVVSESFAEVQKKLG